MSPASPEEPRAASPVTGSRRGVITKLVASLLIAGGFAWLLERGGLPLVPERAVFESMAWWAIPVAFLSHVLSAYFRSCRLVYLLRPIAPGLPFARTLGIGFVGFTAVVLAPLRTGELVRPFLLARDGDVTFAQGLGATVAERIIDGLLVTLTLLVSLVVTTPLSPLPDHLGSLRLDVAVVPRAAYATLGVFLAAFGTMVLVHWKRERLLRLVDGLLGRVSRPLAAFVTTKLERVADGFRFLPSRRAVVPFALNTAAYYVVLGVGHWAMLLGCGVPATLAETWVVLGVLSLATLVPTGPGFFGAYQLSIYYALAMFYAEGVALTAGAGFVFVSYLGQIGVTLISCLVGVALMAAYPRRGAGAPAAPLEKHLEQLRAPEA